MDDSKRSVPDLSVVLPVYNGAATIETQLDAVLGQETRFHFELVVVDNASTDATPQIVDRYAARDSRVRRVLAPDKHNLSYVRNVGVRLACGSLILFCDDDDMVEQGWIEALGSALEEHPFVVSRMEYDLINPPEIFRGRSRFQSEELAGMFGYVVANGAIGVHRSLWNQLGGNDENLGVAGEDFDFAIRAQRDAGVVPVLVADALYHYRQRGGARATFRQARRYGHAHVALYREYGKGRTERAADLREAMRDWWWIISRVPLLLHSERRVRWSRKAGVRLGRLLGSIRQRALFL